MNRERLLWLAIIAACAALLYKCDANAREEIGAINLRAKQLEDANAELIATANSLAAAFDVETVTVRVTRDRWRTLVDSVLRLDTVQLTQRETLIVERATQALGACQDALGTCMAIRRTQDSLLANRDEALKLEIARRPTWFDKARSAVVFTAAGYVLHAVTTK